MEPDGAAEELHCVCVAGQDSADLDLGPGQPRTVAHQGAQLREGGVAGELVVERERAGGERRRQQGHAMEGEPPRRVGVRQDDGGVE